MTRPATLMVLLATGLLAACATDPSAEEDWSLRDSMLESPAGDTVDRLANAENGLELRKWLVADDANRIATAISRFGEPGTLPTEESHRLQRNGFRFVRVPRADLDPFLEAMGGATVNVRGWQGQVLAWRPLHEMRLGRGQATLAIDGRVRRYQGGFFSLLGRSWTVQMEDGPYLQLELVPEYRVAIKTTDLLVLLGDKRTPRRRFGTMTLDVRLSPEYFYVLTCEAPHLTWSPGDTPDEELPDETAADPPARVEAYGPSPIGPEVVAPPTLGEMMLTSQATPPTRGVLVFIPRIAPELYPPGVEPPPVESDS